MKSRLVLLGVAALLAVGLTAPAFGGANALSSSAVSAKSTADKALAKANKALKKANQATQKANAAQTTADAALTNAAAAQSSADAALTAANSKFGTLTSNSGTASPSNQSDKVGIAECPGTTEVTGGGYTLTGGDNAAYVLINFPYGTDAWYVDAQDNGAVDSNWSIQAWANCIT